MMKKISKSNKINFLKKIILTILVVYGLTLNFEVMGQPEPPEPPSGGHGQNGNQQGGGAPIGSGLFILLGLGTAYGIKKFYNLRKNELE